MPSRWNDLRASRQAIAGAALGVLVLLASFAYDHWRHYQEELGQAERSTLTAARLLAEHAERTFDTVDGALRAAYFARVFGSVELGETAVLTLFDRDGTILARRPESPELLGTSLAGRRFMTEFVDRSPEGTFRGRGLTDGADRIIAYATVPGGRFVLSVAVQRAEALAAFRHNLIVSAVRTVATLTALLLGAWLLVRQSRRREHLAAELRAEEAKFRDYAEASGDWFWESDADHRIVWLSQSVERATGVPPDWHYGRRRLDFVAADRMPPEVLAEHRRCLEQHLPFRDFEYLRRGPAGERWVRTSGVPRFDADGRFLGYRGTGRDVTELMTARQRLQEAVAAIPGDFLLFDADDRLVYKSASEGRLPHMRDLDRIGDRFETILRRSVAAGDVEDAAADPEGWVAWRLSRHREAAGATLVRAAGRAIDVIERRTADGGIVALRFDVTEREESRRAVQDAREAADAANRAKSDFLAGMSHELRTPLNAIIGFGQLLQRSLERGIPAAQVTEYSNYIVASGEHLLGLVNDVLDLASVEAGRIRVDLRGIPVAEVAEKAMSAMLPQAARRAITLRSTLKDSDLHIRADAQRLRQVMLNLLSNAIKYNRPGGTVTIAAEARGDSVALLVTDTGTGIPADRVDQLFVPFQRLGAEFTAVEGTGIGLALSRRIIDAMGGRIGYRPGPQGGSTFWLELPAGDAAPAGRSGTAAAAAATRAARGGFSILYIEDNPLNLRLMQYMLETLPAVDMRTAESGRAGVEAAAASPPGVIVLDLNLPDMDGYQVLAALQGDPRTRGTPVVALTASAMPADVQRGLDAGFRAYLTKPLRLAALLEAIDAARTPGAAAPALRAAG